MREKRARGLAALLCALAFTAGGCVVVIPMPADLAQGSKAQSGDAAVSAVETETFVHSPAPSPTVSAMSPTATPTTATEFPLTQGTAEAVTESVVGATEGSGADGLDGSSAPSPAPLSGQGGNGNANANGNGLPPAVVAAAAGRANASGSGNASGNGQATSELPDDIYSFQVMLDGKVFSLPFAYSELAAEGWAPKAGFTLTLSPNQTAMEKLSRDGHEIYVRFVNTGMDVLSYADCNVGGFMLTSSEAKTGTQLRLPAGIVMGSGKQEVVAAYGNPSRENQTETLLFMDYRADSYAELSLQLDAESQKVDKIDIKNYISENPSGTAPAAATSATPSSAAPSAAVGLYAAPKAIGESWEDFTLRYGGELYKLPAPVQAFLDNGWTLQSENATVAAKRSKVGVELRLDNQVLRTSVRNYDDTGQPVTNCYVTQIKSSVFGPSISLELAKGITEKSTIAQIRNAYGEPTDSSTSSTFDYYSYGKIGQRIEINIDREKGSISSIAVDHDPSELSG